MDKILQTISIYSVLLPFITGLVLWKLQDANARIMLLLLAFATISQFSSFFPEKTQNAFYNIYIIIDASMWSWLFYRNLQSKRIKTLFIFLYFLFVVAALSIILISGITKRFYRELVCFEFAIQIICVLIFFYDKFRNESIMRLEKEPLFWFCIALLIYAPGTYFLFVTRYFMEEKEAKAIWHFHNYYNILLYLIITIGFLVNIKSFKLRLRWS